MCISQFGTYLGLYFKSYYGNKNFSKILLENSIPGHFLAVMQSCGSQGYDVQVHTTSGQTGALWSSGRRDSIALHLSLNGSEEVLHQFSFQTSDPNAVSLSADHST